MTTRLLCTAVYRSCTLPLAAASLLSTPPMAYGGNSNTVGGTPVGEKTDKSFWRRFDEAMRADLGAPCFTPPTPVPPGSNTPPENRRGNPPPFDSPPYPTGEWQIGGTPLIGDPNATIDYPLMEALYEGKNGPIWADSRIKVYGWEDFSGNLSTSAKSGINPLNAQAANFPEAYDQRPNRLEENQFVLYLERTLAMGSCLRHPRLVHRSDG